MNEREHLMRCMMAERFAAIDTILFLDTHPNDKKALACLRQYTENYRALSSEYEEKFGMLTPFSENDCDTWTWIDDPWPWQRKENV